MKVFDRLLHYSDSAIVIFYTMLMSKRFATWGAGSRIEPMAKLISPHLVQVHNNVYICEHVWLNAKDYLCNGKPTLTIGDGTYIGRFVQINAWQDVTIENNVLIADRVLISDADHNYKDPSVPIISQGDAFKGRVWLSSGCWIGIGAVILPGVRVGVNSVVAANAVVTQDVPDYTVVGGIPAKVIKKVSVK